MIVVARAVQRAESPASWHDRFLAMLPTIRRYARVAFRHLDDEARDDAIHEAVANALVAFVRLHRQGRAHLAYPTVLARYAVAHFRGGRRVGSPLNSSDVLTRSAQRRHGFTVVRLDDADGDDGTWVEATIEDPRTSVPDQAAFRCDFPAWLATHGPRDRRIAQTLALGHSSSAVGREFDLSPGRISQLRNEFYVSWRSFHGDTVAAPQTPLPLERRTIMNRPYVSFAEVKAKVPIPDALAVLGLLDRFERRGGTLVGVCPLPRHKHGPRPNSEQFKINRKDGVWLWHCFGDCKRGGDVLELVKELTGYDNAHVRFWFAEKFGDRLTLAKSNGAKEPKVEKDTARNDSEEPKQAAPVTPSNLPAELAPLKPLRFRLNLDPAVPYLLDRGLTEETIRRFGLGLCSKGLLRGYVAIPVYRHRRGDGENPVAYLGRWAGEDYDEEKGRPRYKWPEGFCKSRVVYGLSEALDGTDGQPLIVLEGPFKLYHLLQNGFPNTVSTLGSSLSDEQAAILGATGRPVLLMFDADEPGRVGMRVAIEKLAGKAFVRAVHLPDGVEPDHLTREELRFLLA